MTMIPDSLFFPSIVRAGLTALFCVSAVMAVAVKPGAAQSAPDVSHFTLKNGMEVVVIPDHRAPVVTHMVWYKVGGADEPRARSGIAHFLEHLMFKGTEKIPPGEFSKIIARNGGEDNAFTSQDVTAYFQRVARDRLEMVMEMEADRMVNLRLAKDDVVTERKVILEERSSRVGNNPSNILNEQMMAALYQNHPYGTPILGWAVEMRELSRQDAIDFYERYYAPNNAVLVVAGDVTAEAVKTLAEDIYGKLEPHEGRVRAPRPVEPEHHAAVRVHLSDPRAGRARVQRYYLAPSYASAKPGEAEAIDLMMKIAASGSTSRLYKQLVVKQKKAAGAGGWYNDSGLDSGRLGVYAVASDGVAIEEVEAALDAVIAGIKAEGVTQEELERARKSYMAEYVYGTDSQTRLARRYGWAVATGRTVEEVQSWPDRLEKVTTEDIQRVAKKYFDIRQSVTGVLRPVEKPKAEAEKPADARNKS